MQPYLIVGHGNDEPIPFSERKTIPHGYTLVTLAECGAVTHHDEVSRMIQAFQDPDNSDVLGTPETHKREIQGLLNGQSIHVYAEGMKYPALSMVLFAEFDASVDPNYIPPPKVVRAGVQKSTAVSEEAVRYAVKSGVYAFPLESDWNIRPEKTYPYSLYGTFKVKTTRSKEITTPDFAARFYKDSLVPTEEAIAAVQSKGTLAVKEAATFTIEHIFEAGGPGVYYFVICRTPLMSNIINPIEEYIQQSKLGNVRNYMGVIPTMMPNLKKAARTRKRNLALKNRWNTENIIKAPGRFRKLYTATRRIRRNSLAQQAVHNGNRNNRNRSN